MTRRSWGMVAAAILVVLTGCAPPPAQEPDAQALERGGEDITGPYDVVEDWLKPLPWHDAWTFGLVAGVFAESADRIFVLQGGELPDPRPSARVPGPRSNSDHRPGHFVLVLNRDGELVESWTQWDHLFVRPHKVTIDPYDPEKHIWIIDDWGQQIFKFTNDGTELVMTLGEKEVTGTDDEHFGRPTDIAFLPDRSFLVSDGYVNGRIVKFDQDGEFLMEWGRRGTGPGEFNLVHCVTVDAAGRVYVADRNNRRVQVFDENGTFLEMWEGIRRPSHLMIDENQTLWMGDGEINRMVQYDLDGRLLTYWGVQGRFPGAFNNNHSFSVDEEGNLYVADYANFRVQKFTPKANADRSRLIAPRSVWLQTTND